MNGNIPQIQEMEGHCIPKLESCGCDYKHGFTKKVWAVFVIFFTALPTGGDSTQSGQFFKLLLAFRTKFNFCVTPLHNLFAYIYYRS